MQNYIETLKGRLDQLNELRLERARAAMTPQSVQVFNLLPVLLHYNHPAVPGYLDQDVPVGIASFTASEQQQQLIDDCGLACATPISPPVVDIFPIQGLYAWAVRPRWARA